MAFLRWIISIPLALLLAGTIHTALAAGGDLSAKVQDPTDGEEIVLTVSGPKGEMGYFLTSLEALGMHSISTKTFWEGDAGEYAGPLLKTVLEDAGMSDAVEIKLVAADGYATTMPHEDRDTWPILVATRHKGLAISRRDKGPLRIIYPLEADERLADRFMSTRWVWMLTAITPTSP